MHFQEWLQSLGTSGGVRGPENKDFWSLVPSLPLSSSFSFSSLSLSPSSLLGIGALASFTAYWLVTRPRPMRPPCDLNTQSIPVQVRVLCSGSFKEQRSVSKSNIYSKQSCLLVWVIVVVFIAVFWIVVILLHYRWLHQRAEEGEFYGVCVLQGEPNWRRSALLKDDLLLEFYYDDTRTAYDMFQRGLRVAGELVGHSGLMS